jgi:hypothetical protein
MTRRIWKENGVWHADLGPWGVQRCATWEVAVMLLGYRGGTVRMRRGRDGGIVIDAVPHPEAAVACETLDQYRDAVRDSARASAQAMADLFQKRAAACS